MIRSTVFVSLLALALTGCATMSPVAPAPFETKLLNLYSIGQQEASQLNYVPNLQNNLASQGVYTNAIVTFPVASAVGTGAAAATNLTGQNILNCVTQFQNQNQLVL